MRIVLVKTGRADETPLTPVYNALSESHEVEWSDWEDWDFTPATQVFADLVVILGDRYEALAAAIHATMQRIPIAHIHGGETTRGSFDNQIRDAITKLSHIHFVATAWSADKVRSLGEKSIHIVGAPGLDNLTNLPDRKRTKTFILTYHPETLGWNAAPRIAEALALFPEYQVIWTGVNNDPGADVIRKSLPYEERRLTAREYHVACRHAAVVIGNSSSGIIECPTICVPTVNIGKRQDGRECGPSVFSCGPDDIVPTIQKAIDYRGLFTNPYGGPGASKKIADILTDIDLKDILLK